LAAINRFSVRSLDYRVFLPKRRQTDTCCTMEIVKIFPLRKYYYLENIEFHQS